MSTATKRNLNWTAVTFTPTAGSALTLTGVTQIQAPMGGEILKFEGDNDLYPSLKVSAGGDPKMVITTADQVDLVSLPIGTVGAFTATHRDAVNGTGAGVCVYAIANAIVEDNTLGGSHKQFGMGQITIGGWSADGVTNPVAITVTTGS